MRDLPSDSFVSAGASGEETPAPSVMWTLLVWSTHLCQDKRCPRVSSEIMYWLYSFLYTTIFKQSRLEFMDSNAMKMTPKLICLFLYIQKAFSKHISVSHKDGGMDTGNRI